MKLAQFLAAHTHIAYVQLQTTPHVFHYKHTLMKDLYYEEDYLPFLGLKLLNVIKKAFEATTQLAASSFSAPLR